MSNITEEDVMKYCYSRNLMLVTKESLEYMHRPIVVETINKDVIPIEWIEKFIDNDILSETVKILLNAWYWEKENGYIQGK